MDLVALLVVRFIHIPEDWPGWARGLFLAFSPILFVPWLAVLAVCALVYALVCILALLSIAVFDFAGFSNLIASVVRGGGAESFDVMENVGRVPAE